MSLYCVKCRKKTGDVNPRLVKSKNGRAMLKAQCSVCGTQKNQFVSAAAARAGPQTGQGGRKRGKQMQGDGILDTLFGWI
jgi:hypothetical protein